MTDEPIQQASLLELDWLEAASLIDNQHWVLVERVSNPKAELKRSAVVKQRGQDLVTCAAAAELIIRRLGQRLADAA